MLIPENVNVETADYDTIRSLIEKAIIPEIKSYKSDNLKQKLTIESAILTAQILSRNLENVKTHQLRRFFSAIKNIQYSIDKLQNNDSIEIMNGEAFAELHMLKPQFANAVGRIEGIDKPPRKEKNGRQIDTKNEKSSPKYGMSKLQEVVVPMISSCKQKQDFDIFIKFFESIVAYHKAYAKD